MTDSRPVLLIAFHFPPQKGSSGLQRSLKFARYLGDFGWHPQVLTVHPRAHAETSPELLAQIPENVGVSRVFALETQRHLSLAGRYPGWLALPDQWVSWILGAVPAGLRLIRRQKPRLIWSTFPIASAHLIGYLLKRLTGLPWVADFRDPMVEGNTYPADRTVRRVRLWIERRTMHYADVVVVTTAGLAEAYRQLYPAARIEVIANGYDEEDFAGLEHDQPRDIGGPVTLVHSGLLYPHERNPRGLFSALRKLKAEGGLTAADLQLRLRATGHDEFIRGLLQEFGIDDLVTLAPAIAHRQALQELLTTDGLLIMQAASCNQQIPAKLYEYLRAQKPIIALTDRRGDTASVLLQLGLNDIAALDDPDAIAALLESFIERIRGGTARIAGLQQVSVYSRQAQTAQLAALFEGIGNDDAR